MILVMSTNGWRTEDARDVLGYLVKKAHQRLSEMADAALEPVGIDRREFGILRVLDGSGSSSQRGVAANVGIDPTTMVALIDALEAKGMVIRKLDPTDRRRNAVELTPTGRTIYHRAATAYADVESEFLAPLSAADAEQFRQTLRAILDVSLSASPDAT